MQQRLQGAEDRTAFFGLKPATRELLSLVAQPIAYDGYQWVSHAPWYLQEKEGPQLCILEACDYC